MLALGFFQSDLRGAWPSARHPGRVGIRSKPIAPVSSDPYGRTAALSQGCPEVDFAAEERARVDDRELPRQMLRYSVFVARASQRRRAEREPFVVPVVLYHGEPPFAVQEPNRSLPPNVQAQFAALQPRLQFLVDDLSVATETELRQRDLTPLAMLTLLCLRFVRTFQPQELLAAIDRWGDLLRAIEADPEQIAEDAIDAIGWYLLDASELAPEDLQMAFSKNLNQPQSAIMTTAQRIQSEAHVAGQVKLLLRQLERRFGPLPADLTQRLRDATQPDLERWSDRILDARDLAFVFAN